MPKEAPYQRAPLLFLCTVVDYITAYSRENVQANFKDGTEIKVQEIKSMANHNMTIVSCLP